ncbi:hypothetical protein A3F03_02660 [Candidatus Roizmanbacteria bacterium RIFCSPHIGHO2_12_FULL_41_11]|uniref:Uncharacterized protein n=1 Tax=Candidatus Roizmanbacteria bacterium RIFCSPHIGHO2_12_FULL_41_11 TaxID=1802052 RepID=A0A1F7I5S3_9BACT|nr:MAG: hypothetical protein A3F03_02660 [Candidatus Roizmanbacteria bacterium RIFCSPHIGHO2_12_FULL_41_11]
METLRSYPQPALETFQRVSIESNPQQSIEIALNNIFPLQSEENKTSRMRKALGEAAYSLSNEQIETIIIEFQFLVDTWLDEYEREVFKGLTLKEVINEDKLWK